MSRQTTKKLTGQVVEEWRENEIDQSVILIKWLEWVAKDIDCNPESFDKEKITLINLKLTILGKINSLRKMSLKERKPKQVFAKLTYFGSGIKLPEPPESNDKKTIKM